MRITCNVEILNRQLPSLVVKASGKAAHAQLSVGRKPGSEAGSLFLMMCTAKNKNGEKFKVQNNIEQIFGKFIADGKATVRLKEPHQDLIISKGDPLQLKNFLSILKLGAQGKCMENITLSTLAPSKNIEKPKTKLVIKTKKEYPLTTNFPSSLEFLQVSQCKLKRIDSRIFQLRHLQSLNLSDNVIETLPDDLGKLNRLNELIMSHNHLCQIPIPFCQQENLRNSLCVLDLSFNSIKLLPIQICELTSLVSLKVDNNQLQELPPTIGKMTQLKCLSACNNQIMTLPAGITMLRFDTIDLFGNPFLNVVESSLPTDFPEISLVECCARAIRKHRVQYNEEELHTHLCRYLDSARVCWCGGYCFRCCVPFTSNLTLHRLSSTVSAVDHAGRVEVPIRSYLCSPQCLIKFQKNPHAYWKK